MAATVSLFASEVARGESLPPLCDRSWFEVAEAVPLALDEVPSRPFIYLPVAAPFQDLAPHVASGALSVRVSDAGGQLVAGQLDLRPYDSNVFAALDRIVRWRPTTELAAGTYEASVAVADAPSEWWSEGCPLFQGFEAKVRFTVATLPAAPPTMSLAVTVRGEWDIVRVYGACSWVHEAVPCESRAGICCGRDLNPYRAIAATVHVEGVVPPPEYTALEVNFDDLTEPVLNTRRVHYPFDASTPLTSVVTVSLHGAPIDGGGCVTANLVSLFLGPEAAPLASVRTCPDPADYTEVPHPDPITRCDPTECGASEPNTDVEGPDGGPDSDPEPTPEADAAQPEGDAHNDVVQPVGDADVVEAASADPDLETSGKGCGAAALPGVAWCGLSLGWLALRRRRPVG